MSTPASSEPKYQIRSLERGLSILRELRAANAPVRNQDLVGKTGLPKATVSRLLNTLCAMGYVRRTDQGSYTPARGSARSGRAMLSALKLDQYQGLFLDFPGTVYLEATASGKLVPVYRWSTQYSGTVATGFPSTLSNEYRIAHIKDGAYWDANAAIWWVWTDLQLASVGSFVLTTHIHQPTPPSTEQLNKVRQMLQQAASTMTQEVS